MSECIGMKQNQLCGDVDFADVEPQCFCNHAGSGRRWTDDDCHADE